MVPDVNTILIIWSGFIWDSCRFVGVTRSSTGSAKSLSSEMQRSGASPRAGSCVGRAGRDRRGRQDPPPAAGPVAEEPAGADRPR